MLNGKALVILSIVGWVRQIPLYKMSYFPEPCTGSRKQIKFESVMQSNVN